MKVRPEKSDPIWELLTCACNGSLTAEQTRELEFRLENDGDARLLYFDYCELHSGMRFIVHSCRSVAQALHEVGMEPVETCFASNGVANCSNEEIHSGHLLRGRHAFGWQKKSRFSVRATVFVLAGCLLGVLGTLTGLRVIQPDGRVAREQTLSITGDNTGAGNSKSQSEFAALAGSPTNEKIAATLTGVVDCRWGDDGTLPQYGEQILPGRILQLEAGLAQLTFEGGAKVTLQGPTTLTVLSPDKATMNVGKMTALVPVRARGFSVSTPSAEVIDLGTEFGLHVTHRGRTEVHVFQGEVISRRVDKTGKTDQDTIQLLEQQAVSFDREVPSPQNISVEPNKFVREITPRLSETDLPPLPVVQNLALWLAADVLVSTDEKKQIIAWQDILVGDNQVAEDAWQQKKECRPQFLDEALNGKPTIRFDGDSDFMVTTPLASTDDQTLFIVFQLGAEPQPPILDDPMQADRHLISYNGPPHGLTNRRILMVGDQGETGLYWGRVYAGWSDESRRPVPLGAAKCFRKLEAQEPAIIAYSYHPSKDWAAIYLNGELQGEAPAYGRAEMYLHGELQGKASVPPGDAIISRKVLGRAPLAESYFQGDMSEVIIYNGALDESQMYPVIEYLGNKFDIDIVTN